jgi:acyl-CoA thioesterase YciA
MVTISIDKCEFKKPAREGQLLKIYASIDKIGNTSISIYIEARSHNVYTGKQQIVVSTNIKFVKIDEDGEPIPISDKVKKRYEKFTEDYLGKNLQPN